MSCPVCGEFDHKCACGEPEDQLDPNSQRIPITSESAIVKRGMAQPDTQNSITDQVKSFRELFGYTTRTVPTVPPEDESRLHLRIIADEFCELLEAHGVTSYREQIMAAIATCYLTVDLVAVADACGDIDYTVEGLRQCYGIPR